MAFNLCVRVSQFIASNVIRYRTYSYPWEQVVQAAYKKYPNPHSPNVVATDVVEREVICDKIITKRILGTKWNVSYLVTKVDNCFTPTIEYR